MASIFPGSGSVTYAQAAVTLPMRARTLLRKNHALAIILDQSFDGSIGGLRFLDDDRRSWQTR
jgi:hypothetical protein